MHKKLKIPDAQWPKEIEITEATINQILSAITRQAGSRDETHATVPKIIVKALADIATDNWKAKTRMLDAATGEVREEMRRVYRHVESALEKLAELGVELKDHTGSAFDYGLPLKVVTTQESPGINRDTVIETLRPTVYWQKQIIQMGEVVVGTPLALPPSSS